MEECEGHWTAAAGDGDTVLHSLSCHIMYYIMFVLRFVLFFTNSKNDCMEGGGASVCVVAVRIENFCLETPLLMSPNHKWKHICMMKNILFHSCQ